MAEIMTVWSWSLSDFDRIDNFTDLLWWHSKALEMHRKTQPNKGNPP
jgi:hypothetical protein